jgi:hypothetical protein
MDGQSIESSTPLLQDCIPDNFEGKEVVAAVDQEQVEELDPVLQKIVEAVEKVIVTELDPVLQKIVEAVEKVIVTELDPVLQKLETTRHALWTPEEVRHTQGNDGFFVHAFWRHCRENEASLPEAWHQVTILICFLSVSEEC